LRNTGQACICAKRTLIHSSIYDIFLEKLVKEVEKYKIGDPLDNTNNLGPIARFDLFLGLKQQLLSSLQKGAKLVYGNMNDIDCDYKIDDGNFFKPVIIENINKECPAYTEELFGPVFSLFKFDTVEEAIKLSNDSEFGLGASIFTKDIQLAKKIASEIDTGMVFINSSTMSDSRLPYGGAKNSGYGRTSSYTAINEFTNNKVVGERL